MSLRLPCHCTPLAFVFSSSFFWSGRTPVSDPPTFFAFPSSTRPCFASLHPQALDSKICFINRVAISPIRYSGPISGILLLLSLSTPFTHFFLLGLWKTLYPPLEDNRALSNNGFHIGHLPPPTIETEVCALHFTISPPFLFEQ